MGSSNCREDSPDRCEGETLRGRSSPHSSVRRWSATICETCRTRVSGASSTRCVLCGNLCCRSCEVLKCYGSTAPDSTRQSLCPPCGARVSLVNKIPRAAWMLVQEYSDAPSRQQLLQVCRATQLGVSLPYCYGNRGWGSFFTDKTFLSKGANGAVYRTELVRNLPRCVWEGGSDEGTAGHMGCYDAPVAVKTIQKSSIYSVQKWAQLHRECETLRRGRHPHVVELLFVAQGPSEVYIVLQYVAGGDLFDWLVRQQVPREEDVVVIARQLLLTLHYLHESCDIVHRDIKPENILLESGAGAGATADGPPRLHIRLADFGFAKIITPDTEDHLLPPRSMGLSIHHGAAPNHRPPRTGDGPSGAGAVSSARWPMRQPRRDNHKSIAATPCGTIGFAAPEVLAAYSSQQQRTDRTSPHRGSSAGMTSSGESRPSGPLTPIRLLKRIDIFAAGVTLAILLTGCEPFPCTSSQVHLGAVQRGVDFDAPQWRYVSREAKSLLRRMLAPRATDRPSALECLESSWLENGWAESLEAAEEQRAAFSRTFRNSVRSLRKHDDWLFVQDAAGLVAAVSRDHAHDGRADAIEVSPTAQMLHAAE